MCVKFDPTLPLQYVAAAHAKAIGCVGMSTRPDPERSLCLRLQPVLCEAWKTNSAQGLNPYIFTHGTDQVDHDLDHFWYLLTCQYEMFCRICNVVQIHPTQGPCAIKRSCRLHGSRPAPWMSYVHHTDHTDQEYICPQISRSWMGIGDPYLLQRNADLLPILQSPEAVIHLNLVVHFTLAVLKHASVMPRRSSMQNTPAITGGDRNRGAFTSLDPQNIPDKV